MDLTVINGRVLDVTRAPIHAREQYLPTLEMQTADGLVHLLRTSNWVFNNKVASYVADNW